VGAAVGGSSVPVVLIAEMLLLVAVDDKGRVPIRRKASFTRRNAFMEVGLAGALLAELAVDGQLTIARRGPVRAAGTRPADELLAEV
jgi:Golgi phosphoprotein 3 (GPP34)